jgi:DNA-binding LacI/PurR family transcriptional regulator
VRRFDTFQARARDCLSVSPLENRVNVPVSIREVASHADVSVGTVSNVLSRPEIVAQLTRDRVQASIRELGFVRKYLELLEEHRVQGVLITPVAGSWSRLSRLRRRGTPVVLVDAGPRPEASVRWRLTTCSAATWPYGICA